MSVIDDFLDHLRDGRWHGLRDISNAMGVGEDMVEEVASFWAKYGFIEFDRLNRVVRIRRSARCIYVEEEPEGDGSMMLDPSRIGAEAVTLVIKGDVKSIHVGDRELKISGYGLSARLCNDHRDYSKRSWSKLLQLLGKSIAIIGLLEDGAWHNLKEISDKLGVPSEEAIFLLTILADEGLVAFSKKYGKAKIRDYALISVKKVFPRLLRPSRKRSSTFRST